MSDISNEIVVTVRIVSIMPSFASSTLRLAWFTNLFRLAQLESLNSSCMRNVAAAVLSQFEQYLLQYKTILHDFVGV